MVFNTYLTNIRAYFELSTTIYCHLFSMGLIFYLFYLYLCTHTRVQSDFHIRWCVCCSTVTWLMPLVEQYLLTLQEQLSSSRFCGGRAALIVFCVVYCRSYCNLILLAIALAFIYILRLLIILKPLISSNLSFPSYGFMYIQQGMLVVLTISLPSFPAILNCLMFYIIGFLSSFFFYHWRNIWNFWTGYMI